MYWVIFGCLIHLICCLIVFFGIHLGLLKVHAYMFYIALFLPFWGFLIVLVLHFQVAFKADDSLDVGVEKLKVDSELYKNINVDTSKISKSIVPMDEALIVNNSKERRELIMDVLNDNPKEYIEFLQKAGNNDDTEVVHYAVTAMVEISKENDYQLQQLEQDYSSHPNDYQVISEYSDFLWHCLQENLMQGQVEVMNRKVYNEITLRKLEFGDNLVDLTRLAQNDLKLNDYSQAKAVIDKLQTNWPENEEVILLTIDYLSATNQGQKIKEYIKEMSDKQVYFTSRIKEVIAFWKD